MLQEGSSILSQKPKILPLIEGSEQQEEIEAADKTNKRKSCELKLTVELSTSSCFECRAASSSFDSLLLECPVSIVYNWISNTKLAIQFSVLEVTPEKLSRRQTSGCTFLEFLIAVQLNFV